MATEERERIGEARSVHLHLQSLALCDDRERRDFLGSIDRPELSRLREGEHRRLQAVYRRGVAVDCRAQRLRSQLPVLAPDEGHLRATGEKAQRAAFVRENVR